MTKTKIAFVIPTLNSGGAERVVSTLSNTLRSHYEVHIICLIKTDPFYKIDHKVTIHYCKEEKNNSQGLFAAVLNNFQLVRKIVRIVKRNEINILLAFLTSANVLSVLAAKFSGIPVIVSERNNPENDLQSGMWKKLRDKTFPMANLIVVQTDFIKQFFQNRINNEKVVIIPNPISTDFLPSLSTNARQDIEENVILNVGRLHPQKAQDLLIRAFAASKNNGWKLVIVGEGSERNNLEQLITSLKLEEKVKLIGKVEEIQRVYDQAKIFAFSSVFEGFPNALIEAMYFGLAAVSTDCPTGPSELIIDGENGYLIPVNDAAELTEKLNILMEDSSLRIAFGKSANKAVLKYNAENIAKKWSQKIDYCLSNN